MKALLVFSIIISIYSCRYNSQSEDGKTVNIYIAGCDSIFYCEGEKFNSKDLYVGRKDDSAFINKLIEKISSSTTNILLKPLAGTCGGSRKTLINLVAILKKNNLAYIIAKAEFLAQSYFDDISILEIYPHMNSDGSPSFNETIGFPKKNYLIFISTNDDKIYYQYDSTATSNNLIRIQPSSSEAVFKVISELEAKYKVNFRNGNIIIKGNSRKTFAYRKIEDALDKKNIHKIAIEFSMN